MLHAWGEVPSFLEELPEDIPTSKLAAIGIRPDYALFLSQKGEVSFAGLCKDKLPAPGPKVRSKTLTAISAGRAHALAIDDQGKLCAWGANDDRQCEIHPGLKSEFFVAVAAGNNHSLALTKEGEVFAWGRDDHLQLLLPIEVEDRKIRAISTYGDHNLALSSRGEVFAWGRDDEHQAPVPSLLARKKIVAIAAGKRHSMALCSKGFVYVWGGGVTALECTSARPSFLNKVRQIWAGETLSWALSEKSELDVWKGNEAGERERSKILDDPRVKLVDLHSLQNFNVALLKLPRQSSKRSYCASIQDHVSAAAYSLQSAPDRPPFAFDRVQLPNAQQDWCGARRPDEGPDEFLVGWGGRGVAPRMLLPPPLPGPLELVYSSTGKERLAVVDHEAQSDGRGASTPPSIKIEAMGTGSKHSVALLEDGRIHVWGHNDQNQLEVPAEIALHRIAHIAVGGAHTTVVSQEGRIWSWGCCLGGSQIPDGLDGAEIVAMSGGSCFTQVLTRAGVVYWIGDGHDLTLPESSKRADDPYIAIDAGATTALALSQSGRVFAWGDYPDVPSTLREHTIKAIAAGDDLMWALSEEGKLFAWGIFLECTEEVLMVYEAKNIDSIKAADRQCILLTGEGEVFEVTDPEETSVVRVHGVAGEAVRSIDTQCSNSLALTHKGELYAWGTWFMVEQGQPYRTRGIKLHSLVAGKHHSLALYNGGHAMTWSVVYSHRIDLPQKLRSEQYERASVYAQKTLLVTKQGRLVTWNPSQPCHSKMPENLASCEITQVMAGAEDALAVTADGELVVWRDGFSKPRPLPSELDGQTIAAAVFNRSHFTALTAKGKLCAWEIKGWENAPIPEEVQIRDIVHLAAGALHTVAGSSDDQVFAWGKEQWGETYVPQALRGKAVRKLVCSDTHSLAWTQDDKIYTWGKLDVERGAIPDLLFEEGVQILDVAAGDLMNFALVRMQPRWLKTRALDTCHARDVLASSKDG